MDDTHHSTPLVQLAMEAAQLEYELMTSTDPNAMLEMILKRLETDLAVKADHYHFAMERLEASAEMLKKRSEEFASAAKVLTNARTRMKDRIKTAMQVMGRTEIEGSDVVFKLSPSRPRVEITPVYLPDDFWVEEVNRVPDRKKIEIAIGLGEIIPGVEVRESFTLRTSVNKGKK